MDTKQDQDTGQTIDVKVTPVEPVEAPVEETTTQDPSSTIPPVEAAENAPDTNSVSAAAEGTNETPAPTTDAPLASQNNHKPGAPIVAIVAAIFVAIALAAITVYAYMQQQNSTEKTNESTQTTTPTVNGDDVNQAEKDVDDALKSADETDFVESELTDQSLGL